MLLPSARAVSPVQGTSGIPGFSYHSVFAAEGGILTLKDLSLVSNNHHRIKSVYPDLSSHYYTFPKLITSPLILYTPNRKFACSEPDAPYV